MPVVNVTEEGVEDQVGVRRMIRCGDPEREKPKGNANKGTLQKRLMYRFHRHDLLEG